MNTATAGLVERNFADIGNYNNAAKIEHKKTVRVSNRSRNKPRSGIGIIKVTDWTKNWWLKQNKIYRTCMERRI